MTLDYVYEVNGSGPVGLGSFLEKLKILSKIPNTFIVGMHKILVAKIGHLPSKRFGDGYHIHKVYFGWNGVMVGCSRCRW